MIYIALYTKVLKRFTMEKETRTIMIEWSQTDGTRMELE